MGWSIPGEQPDAVRFTASPRRFGEEDFRSGGYAQIIALRQESDWLELVIIQDDASFFTSTVDIEAWTDYSDLNLYLIRMGGTVPGTVISNAPWDELADHLENDLSWSESTLVLDVSPAFRWRSGSWADVSGVPVCPPSGDDAGGDSRTYPNPAVGLVSWPLIEYDSDTNRVVFRHAQTTDFTFIYDGVETDLSTVLASIFTSLDGVGTQLETIDGRLDALEA